MSDILTCSRLVARQATFLSNASKEHRATLVLYITKSMGRFHMTSGPIIVRHLGWFGWYTFESRKVEPTQSYFLWTVQIFVMSRKLYRTQSAGHFILEINQDGVRSRFL